MPDWKLRALPVGPLQTNAYLLASPAAGEAWLVDPGEEAARLLREIEETGCPLTGLLCTHGHFDHVGAAAGIQERWDLPLLCHRQDAYLVESMPRIQGAYGFAPSPVPRLCPTLEHGQTLPFGGGMIEVRHVPGHSPGHVMFVLGEDALVGDCVFAGSIGRTDLPGASFPELERSIRERIYSLPPVTRLHPGHGPPTTVDREMRSNPFVRQPAS